MPDRCQFASAGALRTYRRGMRSSRPAGVLPYLVGALAATVCAGAGLLVLALPAPSQPGCAAAAGPAPVALAAPGGELVGATEYGGPGDPSSGTVGASGIDLVTHPDSFAELGGLTFQTADALGGLPYMTPLRVTWDGHSAIAYKRDFGLGGGPIDGLPRVIDLWWMFAGALGIPYQDGRWSGPVRISRAPVAGAGGLLEQTPAPLAAQAPGIAAEPLACAPAIAPGGVPVVAGPRAVLLPDGQAAAPAGAPAAVLGIIAAGNEIVGRPYLYGGGHGLALDRIAPAYDCSSSVEHLLYGGGLLPVGYDAPSGALESFGRPGPGRWVTIYASAGHVFMYVAGLRWDCPSLPQDTLLTRSHGR